MLLDTTKITYIHVYIRICKCKYKYKSKCRHIYIYIYIERERERERETQEHVKINTCKLYHHIHVNVCFSCLHGFLTSNSLARPLLTFRILLITSCSLGCLLKKLPPALKIKILLVPVN